MKKTYLSPETSIVLIAMQKMIAASNPNPEGFQEALDDENPINPDDMLSRRRRRDMWEDELEDEEQQEEYF